MQSAYLDRYSYGRPRPHSVKHCGLTHSVKHGGKIGLVENKTYLAYTLVENKTRFTP